jgi:hypothetical protein
LVQAFLKKWWVESDFKAPNLPLLDPEFCSVRYAGIDDAVEMIKRIGKGGMLAKADTLNRNESGRFGALKSDSTHHFFRNARHLSK